MKKIKTACIDKLLALSSCFVITNCDKSAEDKKDGEKYCGFNRLNTFVDISSSARRETMPEFEDKTLKGVIDKGLPALFDNSRIPILFRQLSPGDVIDCLTKINNSLDSGKSHDEIYSVLIYYNAFIRSFGNFGLNDDKHIDFVSLVDALGQVCNKLKNKNKNNLKREIIDWFKPDSKNTTIPYGDIKKFFNDICIAFLWSKDVADLTFPSEHFFSKTELDTEKAGFLICCDQIELHTSEILKKVNDDMKAWQHETSPDEAKYAGTTSDGTFTQVDHGDTINKKNAILATIRDSDKTCFTCKNLNGNNLTHNNPLSINTKDHINSIVAGLEEIESVLTCYADKKKEIDRDKEDFKDNFKKIDLDIERLLTAFIYRGIQYNQFFVQSKALDTLFHFTSQQKPLDSLNNALQWITEYTGNILSGILGKIFEAANKIKQVTDPHQGVVSIDLTALQNQIDDFNNKILNDRILFELAYNARRYLTDLFTGDNAAFITEVPNKITTILQAHNEEANDYGKFLQGVCNFLSTWNDGNKNTGNAPGDGTKWACGFQKFKYNKDNNPFIFNDGTEAAGFDFAFNDVQNILYDKYADCVLPETFLECQQLFKRTRDICLEYNGGLFNNIAQLHENENFQNNTSLRSLDLLKICLPTNGENENTFFNFFKRLPNTNGEYIDGAETLTIIGKENKKKIIIGYINAIPELVNQRKNDKNCPKIDDAIGKLTNFILIDNPNEVIDICNYKGYREDFTEWKDIYSLKYKVEQLTTKLGELNDGWTYKGVNVPGIKIKGEQYTNGITTIFKFLFKKPSIMLRMTVDFQDSFPALFAKENNFDVKDYSDFHDKVFDIEDNLYYVLCCIKTLGASIPRRFLKDSEENKNLLDSYRNCRNLSLLIENAITNVLIACARYDTGWTMLGWNDNCTLHTNNDGNWGHYDIFRNGEGKNGKTGEFGGKKKEDKKPDDDSGQYSPFYSEIQRRDMYVQSWERSFLNYKSTVTADAPTSLQDLKCGFFNYFNKGTLIWNKTDFNNYICIGNTETHINSPTPRALYYDTEKDPYDQESKQFRISYKKIIPHLSGSIPVLSSWNSPKDHCLLFNEKIAQTGDDISFSDVLDAYYSSNSDCRGENYYLSLTYANTRKSYSFKTFGCNHSSQYNTAYQHNFSALLNGVKECIEDFEKEFGAVNFTSLQNVDFTNAKSKALLKFYLKNNLKIVESKDYNSDFLNCFIEPDQTLLNNLKNCIIKVEKKENWVNSFNHMTHRKQFYTEIYGKTHEDSDIKKKIDHYNKVFKLFNLEELQGGSVFDQDRSILDETGAVTGSYSNFDQRLKEKVEDFFDKVHKDWCQKVMTSPVAGGKTLKEIFAGLGNEYATLDSNVIDAAKTLKDNIKNIGNWFTNRYNGNSLKNLQDCVDKIGDETTDDAALKELKDLLGTITEGTAKNAQIDPKNVKNKLNEVSQSLDAVIKNLPDDASLKSIFVLKPNEGNDEIAQYKECKDKLEENKKELDKYKDWLGTYERTILNELKTCFDSLNKHKTSLDNFKKVIDDDPYTADFNVLKTLLGADTVVGSIKNTCKDLKEKLNNSPKVFFDNSDPVKESFNFNLEAFNAILKQLIISANPEIQDLEKEQKNLPDMGYFGMFWETDDVEKQCKQLRENFDQKVYQKINDPIQSLQKCIGDIDKILKEHLKAELGKVENLLGETKTTLNDLDTLTRTDAPNSYMETMKYISANQDNVNTSIGKLLAGVGGYGSGALETVVNWKKDDIPKTQFYRSLYDIANGLNNMLKARRRNEFEPTAINIDADNTVNVEAITGKTTYGDRVTIAQSTIIDDGVLTNMAKDNLFNDEVLKECLKG